MALALCALTFVCILLVIYPEDQRKSDGAGALQRFEMSRGIIYQ